MKARIPVSVETRKQIANEARVQARAELERGLLDIDTMILYTLHEELGFGKIRLMRFARAFVKIYNYFHNRYDDAQMFAMRKRLLDIGVDVENLQDELENEVE